MNKKIKFTAIDEYGYQVCPKPIPASSVLPNWWKDMPHHTNNEKLNVEHGSYNKTAKKCVPILDALRVGYIFPLWASVQIKQENELARITWLVKGQDVFTLQLPNPEIPAPTGYSDKQMFRYLNTWIPRTPKGYSCLITNPTGHNNLPFSVTPAIVDTDKSVFQFQPTVWVKKGFEGVVEKNTPVFQIIPFKRDNWESEFDFYKQNEYLWEEDKGLNSTFDNHYLNKIWTRKIFK
jgi:hypothetical protein